MNFWKRYIGDYRRKTAVLTMTEHGAYSVLLDEHYATQAALPPDVGEVCRIVRAVTRAERKAVRDVLSKFWSLTDDGWVNLRAQEEMTRALKQAEVNRKIATNREAKRRTNRDTNGQPSHSQSQKGSGGNGIGGSPRDPAAPGGLRVAPTGMAFNIEGELVPRRPHKETP